MPPSRRRTLKSLACVSFAGLAGCNVLGSGDSPADAQPATATSRASATDDGHTHTHDGATATDAEATPTEVMDFEKNPEEVHPRLVEETSVGADEVLIGFRLEDSTLPFTTEVYEAPADAEVQATETYDTQDLGEVSLLPDDPRALPTVDTENEDIHYGTTTIGEPLKVTLVARHDEKVEWSSWSRAGYPVDGFGEALKVDCYCSGENYTTPAGGTWARVIQVTPTEKVDPGTTITLDWTSSPLI